MAEDHVKPGSFQAFSEPTGRVARHGRSSCCCPTLSANLSYVVDATQVHHVANKDTGKAGHPEGTSEKVEDVVKPINGMTAIGGDR